LPLQNSEGIPVAEKHEKEWIIPIKTIIESGSPLTGRTSAKKEIQAKRGERARSDSELRR